MQATDVSPKARAAEVMPPRPEHSSMTSSFWKPPKRTVQVAEMDSSLRPEPALESSVNQPLKTVRSAPISWPCDAQTIGIPRVLVTTIDSEVTRTRRQATHGAWNSSIHQGRVITRIERAFDEQAYPWKVEPTACAKIVHQKHPKTKPHVGPMLGKAR